MQSLPSVVFHFAGAEFEQLSGILRTGQQERRLRPQTAAVLAQLLEHAPQLVTHDQLARSVWGEAVVTDNSLAQCVSEIRSVLGPALENAIETVARRGYLIRVPVRRDLATAGLNQPAAPDKPQAVKHSSVRWRRMAAGAVAVLLVALTIAGVQWFRSEEPARLSLAVLPFQSRGVDPGQAWFAETVGEDLTTSLSRIPGAHVIARVSTQSYPAQGADLRKVGRELGVRYVVAGNVDRDGDQIVMNLYLADTENAVIRWTERFETSLTDLHRAERLVADRVANSLHMRLVANEAEKISNQPTRNSVADDIALQAWAAWNRGSPADVARAKTLAQQALALDERSILAWKTMASWHLRARISQSIPAEEAVAGAQAAAQRAMDIDPDHPLVHTVYGAALVLRGDYEKAQPVLAHEIATNPSHPVAYYYLGLSHLMLGQPKAAIELYQRALAISPRDPRLSRFQRYLALAYLHSGDLSSALRYAKAATLVPQVDRSAWAMLASACALAGDQPCTGDAVVRLHQVWPGFTVVQGESEWPPVRAEFTRQHETYLRGQKLAGLAS